MARMLWRTSGAVTSSMSSQSDVTICRQTVWSCHNLCGQCLRRKLRYKIAQEEVCNRHDKFMSDMPSCCTDSKVPIQSGIHMVSQHCYHMRLWKIDTCKHGPVDLPESTDFNVFVYCANFTRGLDIRVGCWGCSAAVV